MKRFILLFSIILSFSLSACGGAVKDDKYTAECKKIGNELTSDIQSCAKNMKILEKELQNLPEPTAEEL